MSEATSLGEVKQAALEALENNKEQQERLKEYIANLRSNLQQVDLLIADAERHTAQGVVESFTDEELKALHAEGAARVKYFTELWKDPDAALDGQNKGRRRDPTRGKAWNVAEKQCLKVAVIADQKRHYALELQARGEPSILDSVSAIPDAEYEGMDVRNIDWDHVVQQYSGMFPPSHHQRTPWDCKIQWVEFDCPSITRDPWSSEELQKLDDIISKAREAFLEEIDEQDGAIDLEALKELIDWEEVSAEFEGKRAPSDCMREWLKRSEPESAISSDAAAGVVANREPVSEMGTAGECEAVLAANTEITAAISSSSKAPSRSRGSGSKWTEEEDDALLQAVEHYGTTNWILIASMLPTERTARQCSDRYRLSLDPNIRRARWTEEEDKALTEAVQVSGPIWHIVKTFVPGRTGAQCRERWCNVLDPNIKRTEWSQEEDDRIMELRRNGKDWPFIAAELGRTDNQVFRRWRTLGKSDGKKQTAKNIWTPEEDDRLKEAWASGQSWNDIAETVGNGRNVIQCKARWKRLADSQGLPTKRSQVSDPEDEEPQESISSQSKARPKPRARQQKSKSGKNRKKTTRVADSPNDVDAEGETDQEQVTETQVSEARSRLRRRSKVDYAALERDEDDDEEDYEPTPKKKRASRTTKVGRSKGKEKASDAAKPTTNPATTENVAEDSSLTEVPNTE